MVTAVSFQRKSLSYMLLVNSGNLFSVHQESGVLSLTRALDYESGLNLHLLQVRACESDTGLTSTAEVSPLELPVPTPRCPESPRTHHEQMKPHSLKMCGI